VKKLFQIELTKTVNYGPVKILIPLHILFFFLGFFALPRIRFDFPFLSVLPLYQFPHVWNFMTWIAGFYNITLVLLIIMLTCLEFSNRTYKHQVIFGLSRSDLFRQKVILAFTLAVYAVMLVFIAIIISGLVYSYKLTPGLVFERSLLLLNTFLQTFTFLMMGVLFALLFKNMILSVLIFGFYRVIFEPVLRNVVDNDYREYFPTYFISKLTPRPDVWKLIEQKIQNQDAPSQDELEGFNRIFPEEVPMIQNVGLTILFLSLILGVIYYIFQKRRLN
jgi:hypothetical protein